MRTRIFISAILGVLFVARLGFASLVFARPELALANDTDRYVPIARAILSGQAYRWNTEKPGELLNTIGYPLFLAGVFALLGSDPGDVALAQLFVTGALALILYAVLSRWLGAVPAFVAALLLLIDPLTILWSMTILTETVFAFTLGIACVLMAAWAYTRRRSALVFAGLFAALACLVRPYGVLLVAAWAVMLPLLGDHERVVGPSWRWRRLQPVLWFLWVPIVVLAPWFVRNAIVWDCPSLSSVDRVTMRDYVGAKIIVETEHVDLEEAQTRLQAADPGPCPRDTMKYWGMVLANPGIYARLHVAGTIPVLFGTNFDRWLQYFGTQYSLPDLWRPYMDGGWKGLLSVIGREVRSFPQDLGVMFGLTGFQIALYVLALCGTLRALRGRSSAARWYVLVLGLAASILVLTPGQGGHERFRVPVQPLLCILAAYGLAGATPGPSPDS